MSCATASCPENTTAAPTSAHRRASRAFDRSAGQELPRAVNRSATFRTRFLLTIGSVRPEPFNSGAEVRAPPRRDQLRRQAHRHGRRVGRDDGTRTRSTARELMRAQTPVSLEHGVADARAESCLASAGVGWRRLAFSGPAAEPTAGKPPRSQNSLFATHRKSKILPISSPGRPSGPIGCTAPVCVSTSTSGFPRRPFPLSLSPAPRFTS